MVSWKVGTLLTQRWAHCCFKQGFGSVFILIQIPIQHFRLNTVPDPDPIRIQGFNDDRKLKKICSWKLIFFYQKLLSQGLHEGRPSYKRSLQLSKENIQHFKTWNFKFFLLVWVIFALLDPDLDLDSDYGSGSTDLIQSGSNPDPKPCFQVGHIVSAKVGKAPKC